MRRIEHLINDIRFNTNQTDTNRFSDIRLIKLFNDAQRAIQAIVFMSDMGSTVFEKKSLTDIVLQQEEYDLPSDIYAVASVNAVLRAVNNSNVDAVQYFSPMRRITSKELRKQFGYTLRGNKLIISPIPQTGQINGLQVLYTAKLPTLSIRIGQIASFISGTSIKMKSGASIEDITQYDDFITVVSSSGVIKQSAIEMSGYSIGSRLISSPTLLTDVAVNDYVVIGTYGTSHPELPDEAEALLTTFVERKMNAIDSSPDIADTEVFSQDEKNLIMRLFEKKSHDVKYPPIVDDTYMSF